MLLDWMIITVEQLQLIFVLRYQDILGKCLSPVLLPLWTLQDSLDVW